MLLFHTYMRDWYVMMARSNANFCVPYLYERLIHKSYFTKQHATSILFHTYMRDWYPLHDVHLNGYMKILCSIPIWEIDTELCLEVCDLLVKLFVPYLYERLIPNHSNSFKASDNAFHTYMRDWYNKCSGVDNFVHCVPYLYERLIQNHLLADDAIDDVPYLYERLIRNIFHINIHLFRSIPIWEIDHKKSPYFLRKGLYPCTDS